MMKKQRVLAALLALVMLVGLLPISALAARIDDQALSLEAPADEPSALTGAAPAVATDEAELLEATADASGTVKNAAYSDEVDTYEIYPVPHSVVYEGEAGSRTSFSLTTDVNVVADAEVDTYTTAFLSELLTRFGHTVTTSTTVDASKTNIILAIHGDSDSVTPATVTGLFDGNTSNNNKGKFDPYLLKAEAGTDGHGVITIIGEDTDCVYYGVATLQMMFTSFNGERFFPVQIEDYSNVALRGFIEGFYGDFTYEARASQMRSIRDVKGNVYAFASKFDDYHKGQYDPNHPERASWAALYPQEELDKIQDLVEKGKALKVDYTWSIHIGFGKVLGNSGAAISDDAYATNLALVKAKFQQLYDIGVRSFHVLNDDGNSGTNARRVEFLNDINAWLREKGNCKPLVYCCEHYCKSWGNETNRLAELRSLQGLDNDIYLYWTGDAVNAPMTQDSINWPYELSQHQILTWLNYPCSEHDKAGIYLGNLKHYVDTADGLEHQSGFLSNPVNYPEANKVAYFQLMSWCWNRDNYTSYMDEIWKDTFKYLQPEVWESYYTIAQNTSNCPDSGRYPEGFPESEHLKAKLEAVQAKALNGDDLSADADALALLAEFDKIVAAVANFRDNCENETLVAELEPHLKSLESVATAGKQAILAVNGLATHSISGAWSAFSEGAVALSKWDANPPSNTQNGYPDKRAKAGSKRLQPFANAILNYVETAMAEQFNPGGGLGGITPIIRLAGTDRPNDANAQKMLDRNASTFASYESGCVQEADDYYGVDLGGVKLISAVDILQGKNDTDHDYFHKAALEVSTDGENWTSLVTKVNSRHIQMDGLNLAARYVRLRLVEIGYGTKNDYWTHIREFTVTEKAPSLLYTNVSEPDGVTAEGDGGVYTLTVPSLNLAANEYVGIKLPEIVGIQSISTQGDLPSGVKLQYSVNGVQWTNVDAPLSETTRMGYLRLINTGNTVTLSGVTLTASEPIKTNLSFVSSNVGTHSGSWADVVDGQRNTLVWTNTKQVPGQYAIFDLGGRQPIHDVKVYFPETLSEDHPKTLRISISNSADPNGTWTEIGNFVENDNQQAVPYRYYGCDKGGTVTARYLKLEVVTELSGWMKINELEVNKTVTQEEPLTAVSSSSGTAASADDGNLLTFCAPEAGAAGYWEKLLQEPTEFTGVTVLRGTKGTTATVKVQKDNAWTQVSTLTGTATTIDLSEAITGLRIEWTAADVPSIAEVIFAGEAAPAGDEYVLRPNIYEKPANPAGVTVANGTALANVNLPATVQATMSDGATAAAPVTWSCDNYNATAAGAYTFTGAFTGFNPGCFSLTTTVTVEAAIAVETENLISSTRSVWASGREVESQDPTKAIDGNANTHWSGNKMKQKDNSSVTFETIPDAVSWITVDLGYDVTSISEVKLQFNAKVWPLEYYVQAGDSSLSYEDYSTPDIDTNASTTNTDDVTTATSYANTMHAKDAEGWTTLYTGTQTAGTTTNPVITLTSEQLLAAPEGTRYLRLYFTKINPYAAGGTGIGLKEVQAKGTRLPAPTAVTVSPTVSGATANLVTNGTNTIQLSAAVTPAAAYQGVTWRSNDTSVATVDENGLVTAVGDGSTTIAATALGGTGLVSGGYQVNVRTAATDVTVTKTDDSALTNNTVRVYTNEDHDGHDHNHSITLKGVITPSNATNQTLNWTRPEGAQGMISVARVGTGATATITAVAGETNVGEVNVEVASDSDPTVKTSFKVQVFRALEHDVTISGDAKYGSTLTADTNQLIMTQAGKDALTYQWKRTKDGSNTNIGTGAKTYTLTQDDIGAIISVEVTASEATFYEGTKTASLTGAVEPADGPAAPDGLLGVKCTTSANNDGKITGFPGTGDDIYEYKLRDDPDEAASWTPVAANATEVTDLPAGSYQVRIKATATQKAGAIRNVTVGAYNATLYPVTVGSHANGALTRDPAQAEEGATVTLTVTPNPGYALTENGLSVVRTASGDPIDCEAAEDNTYTFVMPAEAVTVSATFELTKVHITHALTNLTCTVSHEDENVHTVDWGSVQTITLTAAEGYDLPTTITITKAGGAAFTAYTYNNGVITFNDGGLTEDVTITAAGVEKTYQVAYTLTHGLTAPEANAPRTVKYKEAYTGTLVAGDAAYTLPLGIQVTMGGATFTDFTYDNATGIITIEAGKIVGNLAITAAGLDATLPVVLVTGVMLNQRTASLKVNGKVTLTPTVTPEEATEKGVVWSSSDDSVATVNAEGVVTAVAPGTATITATTMDGGYTASCVVTVTKASTSRPSDNNSTTTTTETKDDGTKVTTVTDNRTGTVTETTEKPDGTVEIVETKKDGTVTETAEKPDGTVEVVETKKDGTVTETVTDPEGAKTEKVTDPEENVTITVTDPEGEELAKVELPAEIPALETRFEDVPEGHWADQAIHHAASLKLVEGVGDNQYDMTTFMTRGSLATVLHRLSQGKTDYDVTFQDVAEGQYYTEGVAWAAKVNVVTGYTADTFAPEDTITREQLAVMLVRYAKLIGMDTTADAKALDKFADGGNTGSWAVDGMAWCVEHGILQGKGGNILDPTTDVSRAEVAVMLDRFIALLR